MKKWHRLFNQLDEQNRIKILELLIEHMEDQHHKIWLPGFLAPIIFRFLYKWDRIKTAWKFTPLERLALIYLVIIIVNGATIVRYLTPDLIAIGILFGGAFAIAVSIESIIQSISLIIRFATNRE